MKHIQKSFFSFLVLDKRLFCRCFLGFFFFLCHVCLFKVEENGAFSEKCLEREREIHLSLFYVLYSCLEFFMFLIFNVVISVE